MNKTTNRLYSSLAQALPKAGQTTWWLLKIIIPISIMVSFLQYWGIVAQFATVLAPVFLLIGFPGESAIVFISSFFLSALCANSHSCDSYIKLARDYHFGFNVFDFS
ncbi:MAG TPA: nucleoside recognition domain-containing protein [Paludibacter sp.]|nr:nucleoside recognition domain-containing protein [Paludibacter sp.]